MPARLEVDLSAVVRNARAIAERSGARLIPMVKADAYGMGAGPVCRALEALDPWGYGVATVAEGKELRDFGILRPIVVFTPLLESDLAAAKNAGLTPSLGSEPAIRAWQSLGGPWHLSIDTGMARAGMAWREAAALKQVIARGAPEGVFTHFHSAEVTDGSMAEQDLRFADALAALGLQGAMTHSDNSAAVLKRGRTTRDIVRPGIFLYGAETVSGASITPDPVARLRAPIVDLRTCEPGDTVSYGATTTMARRTRVATLSAGYADGYPRNVGLDGLPKGWALHRGKRVPILGRVTMDMIMVDVTGSDCALGDMVTLVGRDGSEVLTVAEVAKASGMSPYEVFVHLNSRAERSYHED